MTDRNDGLLWFPEGSNLAAAETSGGQRYKLKLRAKEENNRIGQLVDNGGIGKSIP